MTEKENLHDSYLTTVTPPNAIDVMILKGNPQSQYSLMTFDFVNDPGIIVDWKRVKRMHRFMHKKRRPLMTRRARRKMVR